MSVTAMMTLLLLMPLFLYTPYVVLGAIIVMVVVGLIDIPAGYLIWIVDKFDFMVYTCAFFGVLFISVQQGLAIVVGVSILKILLQTTRSKMVVLDNIPGTDIYRNVDHYKEAIRRILWFFILAIEAPINFANFTYLTERITLLVENEIESKEDKNMGLRLVILDMSGVNTNDTSGISLLTELKK